MYKYFIWRVEGVGASTRGDPFGGKVEGVGWNIGRLTAVGNVKVRLDGFYRGG